MHVHLGDRLDRVRSFEGKIRRGPGMKNLPRLRNNKGREAGALRQPHLVGEASNSRVFGMSQGQRPPRADRQAAPKDKMCIVKALSAVLGPVPALPQVRIDRQVGVRVAFRFGN